MAQAGSGVPFPGVGVVLGTAAGPSWPEVTDTVLKDSHQAVSSRGRGLVNKTPFQENFIGGPLGAPKSQVGEGVV